MLDADAVDGLLLDPEQADGFIAALDDHPGWRLVRRAPTDVSTCEA